MTRRLGSVGRWRSYSTEAVNGIKKEENGRFEKIPVMCAQTSYEPFNLEQVLGKISYYMMVWPLYAGFRTKIHMFAFGDGGSAFSEMIRERLK